MKCCLNRLQAGLLLIIVVCLASSGCSAPSLDLSLKTTPFPKQDTPDKALDLSIGVDTFVDLRPQIRGSENQKWLGFIPGVLWVDIASDMPEIYTAYSPYNSKPMQDNITEALAAALRDSGYFREIRYLPQAPYRSVDFRLEGIVHRSYVKERGYYYGSSVYAWLLRIFGLPYVSYEVVLDVDLRLRDMTSRKIIWKGRVQGRRTDKYNSVYQLARGREGKQLIAYNFAMILHEKLPTLIEDMAGSLVGDMVNTLEDAGNRL